MDFFTWDARSVSLRDVYVFETCYEGQGKVDLFVNMQQELVEEGMMQRDLETWYQSNGLL